MTTKRERSPCSSDDASPAKRSHIETVSNTGDCEFPDSREEAASILSNSNEEAQDETETVQSELPVLHHENLSSIIPSVGLLVVAPELDAVHDSWEAFEHALREYAQATYQLYVIRSTTSVKRRNLKIAESAARGDAAELLRKMELGSGQEETSGDQTAFIPEDIQWYSKSLKCTHGWKDRHRGTGKRGSGVVRSTSCPAKMCVTLQHRGSRPDDWKVVVTKHIRTHNHQLSRELYLYYTENRRIYDPELLAVVGDGYTAVSDTTESQNVGNTHLTALIEQRTGMYRMMYTSEDGTVQNQQQTPSMAFLVSEPSSALISSGNTLETRQFMALSEANSSNFVIRQRLPIGAEMPPLGTLILTPGTIPSRAINGGGVCVPRVAVKMHPSWDAFHDFIAQYSFDTAQVFRTRSTVSVAARNTKILASIAAKTGVNCLDVSNYSTYAATPTSRLIPEEYKWFSKLLICTFGWKRRKRVKSSQLIDENGQGGPCPAMLLARMERNVDGEWNVVINRQVQEHNHRLSNHIEEIGGNTHVSTGDATGELSMPSIESTPSHSSDNTADLESETRSTDGNLAVLAAEHREIVVRVPKLQSVFNSWDDFHASLKAYSDATYQLYRTRTTSSAAGRNKKIAQMKRGGFEDNNAVVTEADANLSGATATRTIPDSWQWYSKTLTCTHGWKERNRGTGKRSAHGVRSTACPVKICATVQCITPVSSLENSTETDTCWRVVVTKHVVDHNHNLSRELYQHYCENRRIYDRELLAIDVSNESVVVKPKMYQGFDLNTIPEHSISDESVMVSQTTELSDAGLAEVVNQTQLFGSPDNNQGVGIGGNEATTLQQSTSETHHVIPSVVFLPYNTPSSYVSQASAQQQYQQQRDELVQAQITSEPAENSSTFETTSGNMVLLNSARSTGFTQSGANLISVSCRVHGRLSSGSEAAQTCTCFRLAGGTNYVAIVPASEPQTTAETGFDVNDEAMLYADESEGVWQPSSTVEIEKVTTEKGEMRWRVPRLVPRYTTWDAFHRYLDAYSAATFQLYRVRTTYSVKSRNTRLRQLAANRGLAVREGEKDSLQTEQGVLKVSRAHLVPEQYEWYSKTFLCTHGWKRRSRGSGQRVSHNVRATECPAKVCATLQRSDNSSTWNVIVTKHFTEHNHEISEGIYHQYSEVRRVKDPTVLALAEHLWRTGATRRRIFEFLKERSQNQVILMKDVHNLVQKWQSLERRPQEEEEQTPRQNSVVSATEESASWL